MYRLAYLLCLLLLGSACAGPAKPPPSVVPGEPAVSIYVIGQGSHAGIAIPRADIPRGLVPESSDFPAADYLEFGWGDWDYYQADSPGLWLTLKAAFWPTASVLHVVGVKGAVSDRFGGFEIVRLDLRKPAFAGLAAFIHRSFARGAAPKTAPIGPGWGPHSFFYPAEGKVHIFNNCNTWTARALEAAGYPVGEIKPFMADPLMAKVRSFAAAVSKNKARSVRGPTSAGMPLPAPGATAPEQP